MLVAMMLPFLLHFSNVSTIKSSCYDVADQIICPDPIAEAEKSSVSSNQLMQSIELAKQISQLYKEEEFFQFFNIAPNESIASVPVFVNAARSNALKPQPAICIPELHVVKIKENPDPSAIYFPNCIRVKRCSGCCNHELLSCQPTALEIRNYEIHVIKLTDKSDQRNAFKEVVPVEEHTGCTCDCKVKEKDCSDKHDYNYEECRCICKNSDEEDKCRQMNERKYWRTDSCSCTCRKIEECSTGFYFDDNLCSCKSLPIVKHWLNDESGYIVRQTQISREMHPIVVTLDTSDYRRKHKDDPEQK